MLTGNREFNEIYNAYKNLVLKVAYTYSGDNYHAAEDISQDTFLKLYIGFDKIKKERISSWLFTTAKNSAINYRKKRLKETLIEDYTLLEEKEPSRGSAEEEYMSDLLKSEAGALHKTILEDMMVKNPRWHEAVLLVYYLEMPQEKAAELLGIRIGVLHSLLHRARKWVEKKYGVEYEEMKRS